MQGGGVSRLCELAILVDNVTQKDGEKKASVAEFGDGGGGGNRWREGELREEKMKIKLHFVQSAGQDGLTIAQRRNSTSARSRNASSIKTGPRRIPKSANKGLILRGQSTRNMLAGVQCHILMCNYPFLLLHVQQARAEGAISWCVFSNITPPWRCIPSPKPTLDGPYQLHTVSKPCGHPVDSGLVVTSDVKVLLSAIISVLHTVNRNVQTKLPNEVSYLESAIRE